MSFVLKSANSPSASNFWKYRATIENFFFRNCKDIWHCKSSIIWYKYSGKIGLFFHVATTFGQPIYNVFVWLPERWDDVNTTKTNKY